jgi:penicillin-binding protein 1B
MFSMVNRNRTRFYSLGLTVLGIFSSIVLLFVFYLAWILHTVSPRIEQLRNTRPSVFYGVFPPLKRGRHFPITEFETFLSDMGFRKSRSLEGLPVGEFAWEPDSSGKKSLLLHRPAFEGAGHGLERLKVRVSFEWTSPDWEVENIYRVDNGEPLEQLEFPPRSISSFYAGRVRTQNPVALSDIPISMRYAAMAIEDVHFLEHRGVSFRSILRALIQDIRAGRFVQGGSTITQQLMKNLFFSREKSIFRKIQEALYALVTEVKYPKEAILEAYLNEVYLGQWSTHEIHGVAEGARFYFNQAASDLTLPQSATLAAIIQLPNAHDPHRAADRVLKRRNLVLRKMFEAGFILEDEYNDSLKEPLGVVPAERNLEDIGYFMDLVLRDLPSELKSRLSSEALTLYTTLNPFLQSAASKNLKTNLDRLTKGYLAIKKREEKGIRLQSALIAVDVPSCSVVALQGGSSYRQTQFNRVLSGKRQPGSLFKPFVFLTAFEKATIENSFSGETILDGTPFEWIYDKQNWKPRNYEEDSPEKVTAAEALQKSLNIPTARLAQMVGVEAIQETIKKAGISSDIPPLPSISLGSAEVSPFELAESYTTLANLGQACALRPITQVYDENGNLLIDNPVRKEARLSPYATYQTVELMKGVFTEGTARAAQGNGIKLDVFAGKTGTTNDYKDAWFVGFSPELLTLVWVGYDEEEKVGLTGAAAALPLWVDFMRASAPFRQDTDFVKP